MSVDLNKLRRKRVVAPEDIDNVLSELHYNVPCTGFGRDKKYQYVAATHRGITRRRLHAWLKKQELYQLTQPIAPSNPIRPIITTRPHALSLRSGTYKRFLSHTESQHKVSIDGG